MNNKYKTSKVLDELADEIYKLSENDYNCDFIGEMDSECWAIENQDKCRSDHFLAHIIDGMYLLDKSIKTKKPIYMVWCESLDVFFFYVSELKDLKTKLLNIKEEFALKSKDNDEKEIQELEKQLSNLKNKKKK